MTAVMPKSIVMFVKSRKSIRWRVMPFEANIKVAEVEEQRMTRRRIPRPSSLQLYSEGKWDPSNTTLQFLRQAADAKKEIDFKFEFPDGRRVEYNGAYVSMHIARRRSQIQFSAIARPKIYAPRR
jgi:hypothetical protein